MKMLRFILYVLRHGRLVNQPIDFSAIEYEHLKTVDSSKKVSNKYTLRNKLVYNKYVGSLIGNIAFLKNRKRHYENIFLVDDLQLGYVRIFKAASTSMLREILPRIDEKLKMQNLSDKQIDLLATHYGSAHLKQHQSNYTLFTVVRNPFQRLVSVYADLFNKSNPHFGYQTYLFGILKREMSFKNFVDVIDLIPDSLKSLHFMSQTQIINQCSDTKRLKWFKLEDKKVLSEFLLSRGIELSHSNRSDQDYDYRSYYDKALAEKVYQMYQQDVHNFNYEREYQSLLDHLKG